MAIRRRLVPPDSFIDTDTYGQIPVVSDDAFLGAVIAAAQAQMLAGGVLTVLVDRHPTDLENERVTTRAIVEWKDRTQARRAPEPVDAVAPAPHAVPVLPADLHGNEGGNSQASTPEDYDRDFAAQAAIDDIGDGLDTSKLEEEDLSSIPQGAR